MEEKILMFGWRMITQENSTVLSLLAEQFESSPSPIKNYLATSMESTPFLTGHI